VNIGTIDSSTNIFSSIFTDVIDATNTPSLLGVPMWFNFELTSPIFLDSMTEYAVFVGNPDDYGAVFVQSAVDTDYTGGSAYRDNQTNGIFDINQPVSSHGFERIFHIDLVAVDVPEPSTLAIFALGMIGLVSRRFKKQS
jgi:hypothetical protein